MYPFVYLYPYSSQQDGQYIGVSGVYKPQIKVFEVDQLSLKFERHVDSEVVQFQFLTEDFKKMALLRNDRTVCVCMLHCIACVL